MNKRIYQWFNNASTLTTHVRMYKVPTFTTTNYAFGKEWGSWVPCPAYLILNLPLTAVFCRYLAPNSSLFPFFSLSLEFLSFAIATTLHLLLSGLSYVYDI